MGYSSKNVDAREDCGPSGRVLLVSLGRPSGKRARNFVIELKIFLETGDVFTMLVAALGVMDPVEDHLPDAREPLLCEGVLEKSGLVPIEVHLEREDPEIYPRHEFVANAGVHVLVRLEFSVHGAGFEVLEHVFLSPGLTFFSHPLCESARHGTVEHGHESSTGFSRHDSSRSRRDGKI